MTEESDYTDVIESLEEFLVEVNDESIVIEEVYDIGQTDKSPQQVAGTLEGVVEEAGLGSSEFAEVDVSIFENTVVVESKVSEGETIEELTVHDVYMSICTNSLLKAMTLNPDETEEGVRKVLYAFSDPPEVDVGGNDG